MKAQALYTDLAIYYDFIYHFKNYQKEAAEVARLIAENKNSQGSELLDVGCGTGKHLEFLQDRFRCTGVDFNPGILALAKQKLPNVRFAQADMSNMNLGRQFDVIVCLFSAIGYVKTYRRLRDTINGFVNHLAPGGVVIIEPWLTKDTYRVGTPHLAIYDGKDIKITRVNVSQARGDVSILDFHFTVAEKDKPVRYFRDKHELGMFDHQRILAMMKKSGLEGRFEPSGFMKDRGIFIATKPL
ncbi:MAG: hypothetical protein A3D92_17695 [Bacteroidetes bacterium RIFCSPHIGHO2_02_FULL_44_7]|nr:MAG: hypothetical protein A3D92_17695 [Bacteroidetes bacterium RIFCSPHIGHO2_02_FULL_44_7]